MTSTAGEVLALNAGSSSLKFALFRIDGRPVERLRGAVEGIGGTSATLRCSDAAATRTVSAPDHAVALALLLDRLATGSSPATLVGIGQRVVHGGSRYVEAQRIDAPMLDELRRLAPCDPAHLPGQIRLIEALWRRFPDLPQVACFDTRFHRDLPRVAQLLAIPRHYGERGLRRYGFHGLSYQFLMEELARLGGADSARGRIILAHLGHGASLAAVRDGRPVDTSMGFTPAAGLPMATRAGDLDPGLAGYLARTENMGADAFNEMVHARSGLLGVSGTSGDLRELLDAESTDAHAAEAVALFCYQARKWIGAYAAALGGVDTLVFSGGIGENAPAIRLRICQELAFLGIHVDPALNQAGAPVISRPGARVAVRVMRTDEEQVIAGLACQVLGLGAQQRDPPRVGSPSGRSEP